MTLATKSFEMSQITPSLDSTVTQDRHGPQSPVIRACLKLELEEDWWEDSPVQENMAGECGREARGQGPRFSIHTMSSGHRWGGWAGLAPPVCLSVLNA